MSTTHRDAEHVDEPRSYVAVGDKESDQVQTLVHTIPHLSSAHANLSNQTCVTSYTHFTPPTTPIQIFASLGDVKPAPVVTPRRAYRTPIWRRRELGWAVPPEIKDEDEDEIDEYFPSRLRQVKDTRRVIPVRAVRPRLKPRRRSDSAEPASRAAPGAVREVYRMVSVIAAVLFSVPVCLVYTALLCIFKFLRPNRL